ncbi:MAG: type II CAAX prenyl endopeptidase Rce1 family protein [Anaerolineales bacterium]
MVVFLRRHPLLGFFVLAYVLSWVTWLPYVFSTDGLGILALHLPALYVALGGFTGPFLAGFLMTAIVGGRKGMHLLLKRFVLWRVGIGWYLFAILAVPAIALLGALALPGALAALTRHALVSSLLAYLPALLITFLLAAGGEEPGWRGFALPRLQERYGPLIGTLVLGLLWGGWHFPLVLTAGYGGGPGTSLAAEIETSLLQILGVTFTAIVITWVFNNARGSLLLTMLVHGALDATPLPPGVQQALGQHYNLLLPPVIGMGLLAILIVVFTQGRLSYYRYTHTPKTAEWSPA